MNKEKTKAWKILEFIGSQKDGAGLTEIQHFIWTVLDEYSEESFWDKEKINAYNKTGKIKEVELRYTRGHWCTALYGGSYYHTGLLHEYCEKVDKKWKLVSMPKLGENIYKYPEITSKWGY